MNTYEITYLSQHNPIVRKVQATDPYTACFAAGRRSSGAPMQVLKVVEYPEPKTVFVQFPAEVGKSAELGSVETNAAS